MLSGMDKPAPAVLSQGLMSKVRASRHHKLLEEQHQQIRMTPSAFAHEMSLSTEQRLVNTHAMHPPRILEVLDMSETTHQKFSSVDIDQALFQSFPSEIVFQNYTPFESYEVPLVLRNNDKIPRLVKVVEEQSLYFKVISPADVCSKVAPGLVSTFTVLFTPQENKDYIHRIICVTERERFEVPVRAVGPRAILDFPDHLHFPVCPVKCPSQRTLLVRNVGKCEARFKLSTQSPFSVDPPRGTLGVGQSMQVTVDFLPKTAGDYSQDLRLHYHSGEDIYINMYGAAADVNVRLDRNSVLMKRTYITMGSQRCVTLANRSDVIVHYQWKCFGTEEEEDQLKLRPCSDLLREEEKKMEHFLTECTDDPAFRDHLSRHSRSFFKQQRQLREERLVFSGDHIIISPTEGDIWPNSTAEFTITFKPQEVKIYQQTIYCDVTGRESRLPLRIKGEGIGPSLEFSFDLLDVGNIFIHSKHSYEVFLSNKGYIDAPFRLVPPSSAQGRCFSFSPSEGTVPPGSCHAMVVSLSSGILGMFSEEILFAVEGNPQPISLTFRGRVMGPTFQFSVPELNFGDVSFGFPCTLTFQLNNTSLIPMTFKLRILGDGSGPPSISSMDQVSDPNRTDWAGHSDPTVQPAEFALSPSSGTIHAQGLVDIQVTLCPNCVQMCNLALVVDVQGVGEEVMSLPIHARCVVPKVRLVKPTLELEGCFLNHPFTTSVKLTNDADLPACYGLLPQEYEERPSFLYSSPHPRGIIQPRGEVEISLVLRAKAVGRLVVAMHIAVFGSEEPPLELILSCVGEGPVVHVSPTELDFGSIPVLTDIPRTVRLLNQSPIPAPFLAQMVRRRSQWRVEPSEGAVAPEGELQLTLVACLDDTVPFHDKLHLAIEHGQARSVAVSAKGEGTTIVTDRPFAPSLHLGAHFSSGVLRYCFKLTNRGRHSQQLYWMTDGFPPFWRRAAPPSRPGSSGGDKRLDSLHAPECDGPVFSLDPPRLELAPGQSADMVLTGASHMPKVVRERLVCQAIAGQQGGKRVILTADVTCHFVSPVLELSAQELSFSVKKVPGESLVPLFQPLVLTNASSLNLSMQLLLAKPFGLCDHPNDPSFTTSKLQVLGVGQQVTLWVRFDPSYGGDRVTRVAEEDLEIRHLEHPQRDSVGLRGEVHFPNLHFSSTCLDFGCILSHTESQRRLTLTNRGLLPVAYRWLFLADQQHCCIRFPQETTLDLGHIPEEEKQRESQLDGSEKQGGISKMDRNTEFLKAMEEQLENERNDSGAETAEGRGFARETSCSSSLLLGKIVLDGNAQEIHKVDQDQNTSNLQAYKLSQNLQNLESQNGQSLIDASSHEEWDRTSSIQHQRSFSQKPLESSRLGIEEVFDILPTFGALRPGESQLVDITFYGHASISSEVVALCEVEEGPTYEVTLRGEASRVTYTLDRTDIDFGTQLFDCVSEAELLLRNTGKVDIEFSVLQDQEGMTPSYLQPGLPLVLPNKGCVKANREQKLSLYYLPGTPEVFHKAFQLQVSYFEPETITLRGEGIFPRIFLDLPRSLIEEKYSLVLKQARKFLERESQVGAEMSSPATGGGHLSVDVCIPTYEALLHMEVERLLVKENASVVESKDMGFRDTQTSSSSWRKTLTRFLLPEYVLDFGYVIHGDVPTHIVKATNTGLVPVSFSVDHHHVAGSGFSMELDKVRNLPYCETETFEVKFDPRGANLDLGEVTAVIHIKVSGGPTVPVHLCAVVTMPSLTISTDTLQFGTIQCGQCKVATVQLFNPEPVPCHWNISEKDPAKKKIDKHIPLYLRQKSQQEPEAQPTVFEMLPPTGVLLPGERVNVQVKFTPAEGRAYSQRLVIAVTQSTQRVLLLALGEGEEPELQFSSPLLELGPTLPFSEGEEAEVLVRNPCSFPVEFYSLEFDKQHLEEEKILCMMKAYASENVLLLPPRGPGETLPLELLDFYREQTTQKQEEEEPKASVSQERESPEAALMDERRDTVLPGDRESEEDSKRVMDESLNRGLLRDQGGSKESIGVGDLELNPISRAIARHMGIDLSPAAQAARNRRGIAIIVYGAPLSGKTETAVTLAKYYGAACLSIDAVVQEAVSSGCSTAGLQARQLCAGAAQEQEAVLAQPVVDPTAPVGVGATLSEEALAKHTTEDNKATGHKPASISMHNKTSPAVPARNEAAPARGELSVGEAVWGGSAELGGCVLPEELLVDILSERLQLSDCHRGVVFDGLDTTYCHSVASALRLLLRVFDNRRFIYVVNLVHTYQDFQAREKAQKEAEENQQREDEDRERQRLQEMDEDEYDALPEEEKERIELRRLEEVRKRRQRERAAREDEQRRYLQEQERLREEEDFKKKNKKMRKEPPKEDASGKKSQLGAKQSSTGLRSDSKLDQHLKETKKTLSVDNMEFKESPTECAREQEDGAKWRKNMEGKGGGQEEAPMPSDDPEKEQGRSSECHKLQSCFRQYEMSQAQVIHILQHWDRTQGLLLQAPSLEDRREEPALTSREGQASSGKRGKKEREREKAEKEQKKQKMDVPEPRPLPVSPAADKALPLGGDGLEGADREVPSEGVLHLIVPVSGRGQSSSTEILQNQELPPLEEVLDGLGLGPRGPPVPPPVIFSMVSFPLRSQVVSEQPPTATCFTFMVPSVAEDTSDDRREVEKDGETLSSVSLLKEEPETSPKGRGRKTDVSREGHKERRRSPAKKGAKAPDGRSRSPPITAGAPMLQAEQSSQAEVQQERDRKLTTFRWVIPPTGTVTLKIRFYSSVPGKFDQVLNFEMMDTRRHYQLHCRGICGFPSINKDYRVVFSHCKKAQLPGSDVSKTYIVHSGSYKFGPLLCGKNRDRYKEKRYPENMETLVMHNCSPLKAEIHFCFQHDTKATTFMLDPPSMTLNPNEKQRLTVWAYPTTPGLHEDSIVCCVKENPEPAVFCISCWGVQPELDLDRKQLQFDKVLLNRKVTKSLCLHNNTLLPVAWSLSGLEALGEEFTVSLDRGIIQAESEYNLQVHFRASRPITLKKSIRLEVLDADNILGVVHTENIHIQAEAYDVLLDITFLKGSGSNGSNSILDFGTIRVSEEAKLSLALKNKGKYEVAFKVLLMGADQLRPDPNSLITVTPSSGSLHPNDRPSTVQFVFQHNKEVFIREQPIISLQVIEPNMKEAGEVIGIMPIKVSVQSLFSKYSILPSETNFGPLVYGTRKCLTFTIENRGTFEMRFSICRMPHDQSVPSQRKGMVTVKRTRSRESYSAKPPSGSKVRRIESLQREMGLSSQARLTMGVFSVSPCVGILAPGAQQVVTVDCVADQAGSMEECIAVDISERDPNDHPNGIPYRLAAEVCVPEIVCDDMASVFEEHRTCRNSSQLDSEEYRDAMGIYVQDENKFIFNNVLVGQSARARFRISNTGKVPCELSLAIKSAMSRTSGRSAEVFELTPTKLCVPSHSQALAVVTFSPQSMQAYSAAFEATLEASASLAPPARTRALAFELAGDGHLPRVTVLRPLLRTPQGGLLLQFRPLLVGRSRTLPLVLKNDGTVSAQVHIDLLDETGVFTLRTTAKPVEDHDAFHTDSQAHREGRAPQRASLLLTVGQQAEFQVEFRPTAELSFEAKVHLLVVDNQYEDTMVQLVGDGYRDVITLDNVGSKILPESETADGNTSDILHFGTCHVAKPYQETFTMTNHSSSDVLRFEWPPESRQVRFSPRAGHLHAGCSKEVTVTFCSEQPVDLSAQSVKCKLCRVVFTQAIDQVPDWDDRLRTIRWVDVLKQAVAPQPAKMKVIQSDPEPAHSVVENSSRELELRISAVCNYARFTCKAENIRFKDTMLYQTRVFQFQMINSGDILLEFTWQVLMEQNGRAVGCDQGGTPPPAAPRSQHAPRAASRPASALESVSNLLLGNPNLPPFSVEPSAGTINPGDSLTFCVRFSPLEVSEWEGLLICSIPNLQDGQGPSMAVRGRSLLPDCHFHLEDSDYLSGGRRNPDMQGPNGAPPGATLDPNTRVIEVSSVGIGTAISKVFSIVNPTSKSYSFMWTCEGLPDATFKCLTPKGFIQPGKKAEVSFEFRAQDLNIVESLWTFMIPERNISIPFLLVGMAREPVVYMDRTHLNLGYLLMGCKVHEKVYILNMEEVPFHFSIRRASCHSEACLDCLVLEPLMGTVQARDRFPLAISFSPTQEGPVTFNLVCDVRGKVKPLTVNVKAESFTFAACVQWQSVDGEVTELCPGNQHQVDFKQVELGDKTLCHFLVSNPGMFSLDVQYELWGSLEMQRHLQVEPGSGIVPAGGQNSCTVTFFPLQKCVLRNTGLRISVKNGPSFKCCFYGLAVNPSIHFSFLKHNFGKSFLYCAGMVPPTKTLVISNKGEQSVSLGCLYHSTVHLEVGFQPKVLLPGETMEVPITFYPREVMQYKEDVFFEINDSTKHVVEILGQGIELKIDVEDPKDKVVNLGALQIGQKTKIVIPVVNNSQAPVTFSLLLNPSVQTLLDSKVLSMSPAGEMNLKSRGGRCSIELLFSPCYRMAPFKEELQLECLGTVHPLLVLRGCCHGIEVQLDQNHLPFGAVAKGSQVSRRIVMSNTGDMGARFQWDAKAFGPVFSITPTEGYICPDMVVPFDVTFAPTELSQDLRCDNVPCAIEGGKPIRLTLSGSCIAPPVIKEVLHFVCQVRTQHTQAIPLSNRSSQRYTLKPVLQGEHWSAPLTLVLEPGQQNKPYEITYKPLVMTADGKKHQGSVFFSFPDGTAFLYSLLGTSEPPKASATVSHEVPCKTHFTAVLPVLNWLSRPQRFRVVVEILKPERPDNTITVKGLEYLDVPAATRRSYKLDFLSYREGNISTKVTFRNELTEEYLFYYVNFKATAPSVIHIVEMVALVRQMASATVTVENPLSVGLYLTTECRCGDIFMPPQLFVPALSMAPLTFEYQPLRPGNSTARLTLFCSELGHFHYELLLRALPAPPEKPLCFRTPLGTGQYIAAKFTNYSRAKAEYTSKTDSPDYTVERNITAPAGSQAGTDVGVDVYFEPSQLGETRATLTLSSSLGGDYIFPLIGTCLPPKAQGPFTIRAGSSISIPFKNVFLQTTTFSFQVDNHCFTVKGTETIRSKKTHNVVVAYDGPSPHPCTGKLTVSSPRSEGHGQGVCWVFYLKGLSSEVASRGKAS